MAIRLPLDTSDLGTHLLDSDARTIKVSEYHIEAVQKIFYTDSSIRAAFNTICRGLLGSGIRIKKKGFKLTYAMQRLIDTHWVVFCRKALESIFQVGYVVIGFHTNNEIPFVYDPSDVIVTFVVYPDYYREVRLERKSHSKFHALDMEPIKEAMFFEVETPHLRWGLLRSNMISTMQKSQFLVEMLQCTARAEQRRSQPPLIEVITSQRLEEKQMERDYGAPGDNAALHLDRDEMNQRQQIHLTSEMERATRRFNAGLPIDTPLVDAITGVPRYETGQAGIPYYNNRIIIGPNRQLVAGPVPESPNGLAEMMDILESDVGKITGCPPALFGTNRSNIQMTMAMTATFYQSQREKMSYLITIIEEVFNHIYGDQNIIHSVLFYDSEKSAAENIEDAKIEISLPGVLDPEIIFTLQDRGFFEYDQAKHFVSTTFNIAESDMAKEQVMPPQIEAEHKADLEMESQKAKTTIKTTKMQLDAAEKAQKTKAQNAKAVGNSKSTTSGKSVSGVKRKRTVR